MDKCTSYIHKNTQLNSFKIKKKPLWKVFLGNAKRQTKGRKHRACTHFHRVNRFFFLGKI